MELCDASATDVKVFHFISSANRLELSQSVIIIAIIIIQESDEDKKPFIMSRAGKWTCISQYFPENHIYVQVQIFQI